MKKILVAVAVIFSSFGYVYASCTVEAEGYSSCKPGYYFILISGTGINALGSCNPCPSAKDADGNDVKGTSPDKNKNGLSSCYLPPGIYSDDIGLLEITDNCYHTDQ